MFGTPLDQVQIHTDEGAHALAARSQARAFTVGGDIFFGQGTYQPGSPDGRRLLAHELAHVLQQGGAKATPTRISSPNDPAERQADKAGAELAAGWHSRGPSTSQRHPGGVSPRLGATRGKGDWPTIGSGTAQPRAAAASIRAGSHTATIAREEQMAGEARSEVPPALRELDRLARKTEPRPVPMPVGLSGIQAWAVEVSLEEAEHLLGLAGRELPEPSVVGPSRPDRPQIRSVTVTYTNDGQLPFPNIGGGADQELTASAHVRFNFDNEGTGWTSGGFNFEIWTPHKGGAPIPLPGFEPGMYPAQPGPDAGGYKGLVYADFAYRISGSGSSELTLLTRLGANSTRLGEYVQSNIVHIPGLIPVFEWHHKPTEPYAAVGLRRQTILDLRGDESVEDAEFRVRLTLSSHAMAGTHESEAGGRAELSLRSGTVRLSSVPVVGRGVEGAAVELRFGADGRGLVRYRDFGGQRAGVEAAVSNEVRLHLEQIDLPWVPAFDAAVFAGGRSQQSSLGEGRAPAGEDRPGLTGAWLGPGSKTQGYIGIEIPLR